MNLSVQIVVSDPPSLKGEECPDCKFDALLTFPAHIITENGVAPCGGFKACVRCYEEKKRRAAE